MRKCLVLASLLLLSACDGQSSFTLATHQKKTRLARIGTEIATLLAKEHGWKVSVLAGNEYNAAENIELVAQGKIDFGITTSDLPADDSLKVRTVLPIYPEILVVLYDASLGNPISLDDLLQDRRVGVGPRELTHSKYMLELIEGFGIDPTRFTPVYTPLAEMDATGDAMDVIFTFMGADEEGIARQIERGARLFSFDDFQLDGRGSTVDGYLMKRPYMKSFVIPKGTFDNYPEVPVLTLAITISLVANERLSNEVVYKLVSTLLESSNYLARREPAFGFLSYDMDASHLNFPLHEGTRQYLSRDQPSFLERYAEVMALVFSLTLVLLGGLGSMQRILRRMKKDRVDVYYQRVLDLEQEPRDTEEAVRRGIEDLTRLRRRALEQLQHEKLEANESFSILLDILHRSISTLESRLPRSP